MLTVAGGGPGAPPAAGALGDALSSFFGPSLSIRRGCLAAGLCGAVAGADQLPMTALAESLAEASAPAGFGGGASMSSTPTPGSDQAPAPAPAAPGGASGASATGLGSGALIFFILASLLLLGGSWTRRRLPIAVDRLRPAPFVLIPERPG